MQRSARGAVIGGRSAVRHLVRARLPAPGRAPARGAARGPQRAWRERWRQARAPAFAAPAVDGARRAVALGSRDRARRGDDRLRLARQVPAGLGAPLQPLGGVVLGFTRLEITTIVPCVALGWLGALPVARGRPVLRAGCSRRPGGALLLHAVRRRRTGFTSTRDSSRSSGWRRWHACPSGCRAGRWRWRSAACAVAAQRGHGRRLPAARPRTRAFHRGDVRWCPRGRPCCRSSSAARARARTRAACFTRGATTSSRSTRARRSSSRTRGASR